tara:strand:- start:373 stop:1107 length:735 start_codon:yes stop_codon:yes gene_type:complete
MKFKIIPIFLFLLSCTVTSTNINNRIPYNAKGFAYIFNENDYNKSSKKSFDNNQLMISHNKIRTNSSIKIINPKTNDYLVIKNNKKINYPEFYTILITEKVAEELNINSNFPFVEISEIKKNKSFVAKKAKIYNEEKKIPSNAPVTSVQISNISKNKNSKKIINKEQIYILIASFYSKDTAIFLKQRIAKEIPNFDIKKLKIRKKSNKEIRLIAGPYNTINFVKNDYILLKNFGFEELDIITNE